MYLVKTDLNPYLQDAGLDATIRSLLGRRTDMQTLAINVNNATELGLNADTLAEYIADRQLAGVFTDIRAEGGSLPAGIVRPDAISGIGQNGDGLWFSSPNTGTRVIRWYANGTLIVERSQDCAVNRSATKAELGCQVGSVVQICEVSAGVVGWWGRITVE